MSRRVAAVNPMGIRFHDHGFADLAAGRTIGPCRWPHFDLLCVHAGLLRLTVSGRPALPLRPGEGVLIFPDTAFEGEAAADVTRISVQHFELTGFTPGDVPPSCRDWWGKRDGVVRVRWPETFEHDARRAIRLAFQPQTPAVRALRESQLQLTLASLTPIDESAGDVGRDTKLGLAVREALDTLGPRATAAQLAEAVGLSDAQFRRSFRDTFGQSPRDYLGQYRLREGARLLRETHLPTKAIARALGYADVANFHHAFRRLHRRTPAAYRDQFRPRG